MRIVAAALLMALGVPHWPAQADAALVACFRGDPGCGAPSDRPWPGDGQDIGRLPKGDGHTTNPCGTSGADRRYNRWKNPQAFDDLC